MSIAIMAFLVGSFLPRLGFKKAMLISLSVVFFACLGMYFGNTFWSVKLLFLATGLTFAVVKVAVFALIGYITDTKKDHSSLMNLIETVFMIGIIFMYVVFPLFFDDENNRDAWLRGYLLMAALIAVAFVIIAFAKFDITSEPSKGIMDDFKEMFKLFKLPLTWIFVVFAFLYVMTEQGIMTWLPTFNKDTLKLDPKLGSQMAVLLMICIALGRFLTGIIAKRVKWIYISAVCVVLAVVLVLLVLPMAENIEAVEVNSIGDLPAVGGTIGSLIVGNLFDSLGGDKVFYLSLVPFGIMFISFFVIDKLTSSKVVEA